MTWPDRSAAVALPLGLGFVAAAAHLVDERHVRTPEELGEDDLISLSRSITHTLSLLLLSPSLSLSRYLSILSSLVLLLWSPRPPNR